MRFAAGEKMRVAAGRGRGSRAAGLVVVLATGALVALGTPATAAQSVGFPTFTGPAVPAPPVGYSTGNTMQAIYDAESGGAFSDAPERPQSALGARARGTSCYR